MHTVDILIVILLAISGLIWLFAKVGRRLLGRVQRVSCQDILKRLEAGEEIIILDIREKKDFNNFLGHIVHSINMPFLELKEKLEKGGLDLSGFFSVSVVIVEQSDSLKGAKAYKMLKAHGFEKVEVLDGGFAKWIKMQLPVTRYEG